MPDQAQETTIHAQLKKVLESAAFARSERLRSFLQFVVQRSEQGAQDQLKEYVIGLEVYGKGTGFDPRTDSIVRVEAARLRNKLREYYETEGQGDSIRIELPKGTYAPIFHRRPPVAPDTARHTRWWLAIAGVGLVAVAMSAAWFLPHDPGVPPRIIQFTSYLGYETQPAFAPEGRRIAFVWAGEAGGNLDIYTKPVGGNQSSRLTTDPGEDLAPAWSPDGRQIAFLRLAESESGFWLASSTGGEERKLTGAFRGRRGLRGPNIAWFPDGSALVIVDKQSAEGPAFLDRVSLKTGERRRLTTPPHGWTGDSDVALSPNGRTIAFTRSNALFTNDLYVMHLNANDAPGSLERLTFDDDFITGVAWAADGSHLIFASERNGQAGASSMWKISARGGKPERLVGMGVKAEYPAVSSNGKLLAYSDYILNANVWRIATTGGEPVRLISSSRESVHARYSPDGRRIAFQSNRTGAHEIWVCDAEGRSPARLTFFDGFAAFSPRWSPDGRTIAFDYRPHGNSDVYAVSADGGAPQAITADPGEDGMPSWSLDGHWIYFASKRSGKHEIWKTPTLGGVAVQLTNRGGIGPVESPDGKYVYYAKGFETPGLWRVPAEGGTEEEVLDQLPVGAWKLWAVTKDGIYFGAKPANGRRPICFYSFTGKRTSTVNSIGAEPPGNSSLSVSPDGQQLLFDQKDQAGSDIILVENFK